MLPLDVITGAILVISLASLTLSLPEGPPLRACHRMLPGVKVGQRMQEGHTARAQNEWPTGGFTRQPPYYIQMTGGKSYQPNQRFQISVVANQTGQHNYYRGLLVQARRVKCASNGTVGVYDDPLGRFSLYPNSRLNLMNCEEKPNSAISHKAPNWKINETMYWTAPDRYQGHIIIRVTIVRMKLIYWTNLNSTILMDPNASPLPPCRGQHVTASLVLLCCTLVAAMVFRN